MKPFRYHPFDLGLSAVSQNRPLMGVERAIDGLLLIGGIDQRPRLANIPSLEPDSIDQVVAAYLALTSIGVFTS